MTSPNLFIVGAAKAGTSSLWSLLKQHSKIFMPEDELFKEPAYFSQIKTGRFGCLDQYMNLFCRATESHKYLGEASTAYLSDPESANLIHAFNPDSKIIIMLRNPIHRAYSMYNWMVQEGYEHTRSFEDALAKEERRQQMEIPNFFEPEYFYNYMYFSSGLYCEQIERYTNLFGEKNVYIGIFEDFVSQPALFLDSLLNFLDVEREELSLEQPSNPSRRVLHPYISFVSRKIISCAWCVLHVKPNTKNARDFLTDWVTLSGKPPKMNRETYAELCSRYQFEYEKLEKKLRINPQVWKELDQQFKSIDDR